MSLKKGEIYYLIIIKGETFLTMKHYRYNLRKMMTMMMVASGDGWGGGGGSNSGNNVENSEDTSICWKSLNIS